MNITENGVFKTGPQSAKSVTLLASGDFGGGTIEIGYLVNQSDEGTFQPVADGSFTAGFDQVFDKGVNTLAAVRLTGATGANIDLVIGSDN